jgi:hypothetical protein
MFWLPLTVVVTVLIRVVFATASPWFADGGNLADPNR